MMIKFTYCKNFATAEELEVEWDKFTHTVTRSIEFPSKEASKKRGAFIGGTLKDPKRNRADDNIAFRTHITADIDLVRMALEDIELYLRLELGCAFIAYSTYRHTDAAPRIRIVIPLSRAVTQGEYRALVDKIARLLADLGEFDKCSWVWAQLMFLASHQPGVKPWSVVQNGEPWQVPDVLEGVEYTVDNPTPERGELSTGMIEQSSGIPNDDFGSGDIADLELALAQRPLDLTPEDVGSILDRWPAEPLDYDGWAEVGMALYHQFEGRDEGLRRWVAWSEKSPKHNPREMRMKYRSFGGRMKPKTMASIIRHVGGLHKALAIEPAGDTFAALEAQARAVKDVKAYGELRDRVRKMSDVALPLAMRAALALAVFESFGKNGNLTKAEVKREFRPARRKGPGSVGEYSGPGEFSGPEWLSDWVFCGAENTYERISVRDSMIPAAFKAYFGGEPEVMAAEVDAAAFALNICKIPKVSNLMFWPGAGQFFEHRGLRYLNTYEESGVTPCETLEGDEDGKRVVELFLQHLRNLIPSEREQRIVIDFLAFVYQNPGRRVRWSILLYGIEGAGKTYFFKVAQLLMGHNAKTVSTTAINSEFTGWAAGARLINIDEIRIAGTNKYGILDKMKPMISDDTISVIHKGKDERSVPNFASYMMSTNHADAIPISDSDRRYSVITTRYTTKEELNAFHGGPEGVEAYFSKLFSETARRADAIACFLRDWKVDASFNPEGRAPETDGLLSMRSLNVSEERDDVEAAIDNYACACAVISRDLLDVTELNKRALLDGKSLPSRKQLGHILSNFGLQQIEGRRIKLKDRTDHYVWYNRNKHTDEEARRLVREYHDGDRDFSDAPF
jgi:hypothetical protein